MSISEFVGLVVKLFLLLTPFFILSLFIATTEGMETKKRKNLAFRVGCAVTVISLVIFLFGELIFKYLGITLEAFRIGCGLVLMLSGIDLVRDSGTPKARIVTEGEDDPAVSVCKSVCKTSNCLAFKPNCGDSRSRTDDPLLAKQVL